MAMITIVGCGPGTLDHLTPVARQAIWEAEILIGAQRLLDLFPELGAERIVACGHLLQTIEELVPYKAQKRVVVLVTGDPGVCSLARPLIQRFGIENCRVIPGISSVQVAFARLGLEWFGARLLSAHNDTPHIDSADLASDERIAILAGNPANAEWMQDVVQSLLNTHDVFVCSDLTLAEERVTRVSTKEPIIVSALPSRSIVLLIKKEIV